MNSKKSYVDKDVFYILVGLMSGAAIGWNLNLIASAVFESYDPKSIEKGLYGFGGALILIGLCNTQLFRSVEINRICTLLVCATAIVVFANVVEIFWHYHLESYFLIGGYIPSSDADEWLTGGWRLLSTSTLSSFDQRRPINAAMHGLRLLLTGNYQDGVLITGLIAGASTVYVALAIRTSMGWVASAVFFIYALSLIRTHLPVAMTEIHGFIFGCFGFGLLWRAVTSRSLIPYFYGLAVLSIGLNARSGPFLILLAVLLWGVFNLSASRRYSMQGFVVGLIAISIGFLISSLFAILWGSGSIIQQTNFALTFYGIAVGGKGWEQALIDYPDLIARHFGGVRESEVATILYKIGFQEILKEPTRFISYYVGQLVHFVHLFIKYELGVSRVLLLVAGIWALLRWREPLSQFAILLFLGVLFSAPFLMQDAGVRPFAPAYPIVAAIPAVAVGYLLNFLGANNNVVDGRNNCTQSSMLTVNLVGVLVIFITVCGPLAVVQIPKIKADKIIQSTCNANEKTVVLDSYRAVALYVVQDSREKEPRIPTIRYSIFLDLFPDSQSLMRKNHLQSLAPPFSFVSGYSHQDNERIYFVVNELIKFKRGKFIRFCLQYLPDKGYPIGYISN